MAVFYRPPDPNVGGLGPLLPREQTPPSVDNPPSNSRRIALLMAVAMVCWAPPPPQPQQSRKLPVSVIAVPEDTSNPTRNVMAGLYSWWKSYDIPQRLPLTAAFAPSVTADNPPFAQASELTAVLSWQAAPPLPDLGSKLPISVVAVPEDNPPFGSRRSLVQWQWWNIYSPLPQLGVKIPQPLVIAPVNDPPFGTRSILSNLITAWNPPPPLPQLPNLLPASATAVPEDNPPFKKASDLERMQAIVASWYPPPPLPQLNRKVVSIPVFVSFPWELDAVLTCRGDGVTGSIIGQTFFVYMKTGSGYLALPMMNVSPVPVDFTQLLTMDLTARWGAPVTFENIILTNIVLDIG